MTGHACPICGGDRAEVFFSLPDQPVLIGVMWPDADSARGCRRGDIDLAFCPGCGHVWNVSFQPALVDYDRRYDNSLHFSPKFQAYTRALVERLVRTYDLRGKHVVDIGCGKGDFLAMLCEAGGNSGHGFDPSHEGERVRTTAADRITWSTEYFGEGHASIPADLVTSRYVLEHVPDPRAFLGTVRRSIARPDSAVVVFEVPDIDLILRQMSVWDVIYEHCSFFGVESLTRAFAAAGFDVLRVEQTYGRQFVTIEARVAEGAGSTGPDAGDLDRLAADVEAFRRREAARRADWQDRLADWRRRGLRAAAWGAGAKAVGFLNMLDVTDGIGRVVDINPHKCGKHLAGTGQRIVAPAELLHEPPDLIVLMNPIYRDEVVATLSGLGIQPELVLAA